jgi:hypothetical protein
MDQHHEVTRHKARLYSSTHGGSAALGHLYGGVKGLGIGVVGGFTSLVGGVVDGARQGGSTGVLKGVGRGLLGTATKPVQGVLDFFSGTAAAAQEMVGGSARSRQRQAPSRLRLSRVTRSLHHTLPPYSQYLADAQAILMAISHDAPLPTVDGLDDERSEM